MRYFYIDYENKMKDGLNGIAKLSSSDTVKKPLEKTYGIYSGWFILVSVILVLIAVIVFVLTVIL